MKDEAATRMINPEVKLRLMNLHDAFLNAAIAHREKWKAPIENDIAKFHISDHGRFERIWVTFLFVLVESWQSKQMAAVRSYVASVANTDELTALIRSGKRNGNLARMRKTRDYMCHRDQRKYWDDGCVAVCGQLDYHTRLHDAFSSVLLQAFETINE